MSQDEVTITIEKEVVDVVVDKVVDAELILSQTLDFTVVAEDNTKVQEVTIESEEIGLTVETIEDIEFIPEEFTDVLVIAAGNIGVAGPPGSPGPPGGKSGSTHVFTQGSPSAVWVIPHNLGWWPSVTVVDTGGSVITPDVHYDTDQQVTLTFGSATTGKAYLNPGNPGDGSTPGLEDESYLHTQTDPLLVWSIIHNLAKYPSVTISDLSNNIVIGDVQYISLNVVQITFTAPTAGRAYLI